MKEYLIHLIPRSSFQVPLHSDTLFGAICWGIRMLLGEGKLLQVLEAFQSSPPFLVSSAFPFRMEGEGLYQYFLPMPVLQLISKNDLVALSEKSRRKKQPYHTDKLFIVDIADRYKEFKKIQFIEASNFKKALKQPNELELFNDFLDGFVSIPRFGTYGIKQKNSLDRLSRSTSGAGSTFYEQETDFRESYGLYFFLKTNSFDDLLSPVLRYLEDSGIGPNARTGKNWFRVNPIEKTLFEENDGESGCSFVTLSRYIKNEPIDIKRTFYRLASVRSKVESRLEFAGEDIWKSRVIYFSAGSVITPEKKAGFYGRLMPVKTIGNKTIYQYGYAYPVWIRPGGKDEI